MKTDTIWIALATAMLLFAGCMLGGATIGVVWYMQPAPTPVFQPQEVIEVPVYETVYETVEVPVEVIKTVEVEKVVVATPQPTEVVLELPAPTETPVPETTCFDDARIEMQPVSDIQAGALEIGDFRRLTWIVENTGDCVWDGYTFESQEDALVLEVPYTLPGEMATITYEFRVRESMKLRMFLIPAQRTGLLGLSNSNSVDAGAIYRLETYRKSPFIGGSNSNGCPPGG